MSIPHYKSYHGNTVIAMKFFISQHYFNDSLHFRTLLSAYYHFCLYIRISWPNMKENGLKMFDRVTDLTAKCVYTPEILPSVS